ncbi:MAG: efflux RND transporter periplasmic adaptor subunit [Betaproteobacteria bacterium]
MSKRALVPFAVVSLVLPLAAACSRTSAAPMRRGGAGAAVPVVTATVAQKDVPVDIAAIGNVEAYDLVTVRSQVTGQLTEAHFREGDFVKKGDLLFRLDARPFEAALQQAQANLSRDEALLAQAEAQLGRDGAQADYQQLQAERQAQLASRGIVSKDMAEQARAAADAIAAGVKADKAAVESAKAQLTAQQAAVDNARVQLGFTVITSPITGRTGNLAVKVGNLVTANSTELISIAGIQPVYVTFAVPAVHLPTIKEHMTAETLSVVATPQDADARPATGRLTFVDNAVDPATDTIKLKATFDNPDRRLWPGQFARVSLRVMTLPHAVVVPTEAVQTGQDGQYVFVVKQDATVEQRPVSVGQRVDQDVVVDKGLQPGETVVTEGQLRLEPGTRVETRRPAAADAAPRGQGRRGGARQGS